MADDILLKGKLGLDLFLRNPKAFQKELEKATANIDKRLQSKAVNQKTEETLTKTALTDAKNSLEGLATVANERRKVTQQVLNGEKEYDQLNKRQQKLVRQDVEAMREAIGSAQANMKTLAQTARLTAQDGVTKAEAKQLRGAFREGAESLRGFQNSNKVLEQATDTLGRARRQQAEAAKQAAEQDKRRVAADKLAIAKREQGRKEQLARDLTGKRVDQLTSRDFSGFSTDQKSAVAAAFRGREQLAQTRQTIAQQFGKSEEAINRTSKALDRAKIGVNAYNQTVAEGNKIRDAEKKLQSEIDAQRKVEDQKVKAFAQREAQLEKQRQADIRQREKDTKAAFDKREKAAQEEQRLVAKLAAQQTDAYNRELDAREKVAYKAREKQRKAETQEIEREAKRRSQIAATIQAQRQRVAQSKAVAQDIFGNYGAKGFKDIDYRTIQRQDLKGLQDYAKELQKLALIRKNAAAQSGASRAAINRTTAAYERQTLVVRELAHRYRELNHPLQQVSLLFRQFFRFALGYGVLYSALGGIKALIKGVADLDEQLKSIQAITASSNTEMRSLETTIKRVATTTKFTTGEIALATQVLGQAGVTAQELPSALQATADFAAATNSNLEVAADLLTTTRNVFKELDDNTLSDQLTKAINISKLTAEDLKTILSLAAQTAQSYNLTSDQFLAAVTTLRNAGIKASTVATGLRQGLLEVFSPDASTVTALKARYRQLGDVVTDEVVRQRFFGFTKADNPLLAVLTELKRLGFADDAQKEFQRAFDVRAANAIKALIKNYDELAEAEAKITFGLSAAEAADIQMSSLNNTLKNLGAAFTVLGSQIGGEAVRSLQGFTEEVTNLINELTDLDIKLKEQGKAGLSAAFLPTIGGALAGGLAGRGVKGKILGTAAGGAAGAAVGVGEGGIAAGGAAGLLALLGFSAGSDLFNAGRSAKQSFKASGKGQLGLALGGTKLTEKIGTKLLTSGLGRGILAFIPAIGPLLSMAITAITFFSVFSGFLSDAATPAQEASRKLQGAQARLDGLQAEQAQLQQFADEFDVDAAAEGQIDGKAANTIVELGKTLDKVDDSVQRIFGGVTEGTRKQLLQLLQEYASSTEARRAVLAPEIKALANTQLTDSEFDRLVFQLGADVKNLKGETVATIGQFNTLFGAAREKIIEALSAGEDLDSDKVLNAQNLLDVVQLNEEYAALLRGEFDPLSQKAQDLILQLTRDVSQVANDELEQYRTDVEAQREVAVRAQVRAALTQAAASEKLNLRALMDDLIDTTGKTADEALSFLDTIEQVIQEELARLEEASRVYEERLKNRRRVRVGRGLTRLEAIPEDIQQGGEEAAVGTVALTESLADVGETRDRLIENQRQDIVDRLNADIAEVEKFVSIASTQAGEKELARQGAAIGGEVGRVVQEILAAPDQAGEILQTEVIDKLDPESYTVNRKGLIRFTSAAQGLGVIIELLRDVSETTNTTLAGEKKLTELQATIPQVSDLIAVDEIEAQIRKISTEGRRGSYGDPQQVESLLLTQKEAQRRILEATLRGVEIDIKKVAGTIDAQKATGDVSKSEAENLANLQKRAAKLRGDISSLDEETLQRIERVQNELERSRIRKSKQVQEASIAVAERWIELAGATTNQDLLERAITQINAARAKLREEIEKELILENFEPGTELFEQELRNREELLRDFTQNGDELIEAFSTLTDSLREQAQLLRDKPVTEGFAQDAISESYGTVGNKRRREKAQNEFAGNQLDIEAVQIQRDNLQQRRGTLTRPEDIAAVDLQLESLSQEMTRLGRESAILTLTMMENSDVSQERVDAELAQIGNITSMIEALEDSSHAFSNFAENLRANILQLTDDVSAALVGVILDGEDFKDAMGNVLNDLGRRLLEDGINTLITEGSISLLKALPAQIGGGLQQVFGVGTEAATGAAEGAATATAVTAALTPATASMGLAAGTMNTAALSLNTAGFSLQTAAVSLQAAATAMGASSVGSGVGGVLPIRTGGIMNNGKIDKFSRGGIISGPGTGTSDSILGVGPNGLIAVSNKEAILNAKAVELLGEDFIHAVNGGKMSGFNTGGVAERGQITSTGATAAKQGSSAAPTVNNKNETTIVNAIDSSSVVAAGLETPAGNRAIMNFMRANKSKIQRIIQ